MAAPLCGLWVDDAGTAHVSVATPDGGRGETTLPFRPFGWLSSEPFDEPSLGIATEPLRGGALFQVLAHADSPDRLDAFLKAAKESVATDVIRPLESQVLVQARERLYREMPFSHLRRLQLDIETGSGDGSFSDPTKPGDRVLAIGLRFQGKNELLLLGEDSDAGERELLRSFTARLAAMDPDVIEGHNLFKFDLDYLRTRSRKFKVPCAWGRFGQNASFRPSRLKVAERWIDFPRCDLPGRAVIDTYLLVNLYDITAREMTAYGLKDVAVYFGITDEDKGERTYLEGSKIAETFRIDRQRFCAYLEDDLRETQGVADLLLPTYFEQVRTFPTLLQEATLRGTTTKIDLLFQEEYYHARQSCPAPAEVKPFEGGFTRSFREGVFKHVLHFDVASLYPSLLLSIGRNPASDSLGVFIPLLKTLREYRLKYKLLARTSADPEERAEAHARQASFKILINSFYGYLGFSGARFGDGELASEVTRRGRELLQNLIEALAAAGAEVLEADTDGIYLSSAAYFEKPDVLLSLVSAGMPPGIELEYDGQYAAMFCYKAKNYALTDGSKVILRGSALRSRGTEPYLKRLTDQLIRFLLGVSNESPLETLEGYRKAIAERTLGVDQLAKGETLNQNPEAYERLMAEGGKPRRASAEAALQMSPRPRMGERVRYYITAKQKGKTSDWQRARPLDGYDAEKAPYDPGYYLDKLDDWLERYGNFLGAKPPADAQFELL